MSYFGKFYLVGPEATKAANWLFTADVSKVPGKGPASALGPLGLHCCLCWEVPPQTKTHSGDPKWLLFSTLL